MRHPLLPLVALLLSAPSAVLPSPSGTAQAAELLVATDRPSGLALAATPDGSWVVERAGSEIARLPMPSTFSPVRIEALGDGWIVTGTAGEGDLRDLVVLRGSAGRIELLPVPKERQGTLREYPIPLIEGGELAGLAWLEGNRFDRLEVRAARWRGGDWDRVETVSRPATADDGEAWTSALALTGSTLPSGDWLLLWSAYDGADDEIVWSLRQPEGWTPARRVHADNRAPDVTPTVVATAGGALAAWSTFADGHYRLGMARFDPTPREGARGDRTSWSVLPTSDDRGASEPQALRGADRLAVVYRTVEPDGVHLIELDHAGEIVRRGLLPSLDAEKDGDAAVPAAIPPPLVYLAFGDSITEGALPFDELNLGGYPGRLGPQLGCGPGICSVDNQGKGGERTGQAVTRIDSVLAAKRYDIMLLMEGTNDIFQDPPISNNTIQFNLETIADKAEADGVEPLLASIIHFHPNGKWGNSRDAQVQDLRNRLQTVAATRSYSFADPWTPLCPNQSCFNTHYFGGVPSPDPVGHPDASGFDILTNVFAGPITAVPAPTEPAPVSPSGQLQGPPTQFTWDRESPTRASWYELRILDAGSTIVFGRWYQAADICTDSSCTAFAEINLSPGTYTWRVRGRNPAGYSLGSSALQFTVPTPQGPTLTLESGGCGVASTVSGADFPANSEIAVVMAAGSSGYVKPGGLCAGISLEISEPFVLPATKVKADATGSFTVQISGEECNVQAVSLLDCQASNLLVLP